MASRNLMIEIAANVAHLRRDMTKASGVIGNFTKKTERAFKGLGLAIAGVFAFRALTGALRGAAQEAASFETAMSEVSTLLSDKSEIGALTSEAKRMALEFGGLPADQAKSFYQIISAGAQNAAQATEILTAANKLAVGGVTSVEIAADGLTTILNVYEEAAGSAADVSDAMFVAMRAGKTTVEQLSLSVGKVAPLAKAAGVSLDELLAVTAALTKGGITTKESVTGLRAVLAAVVKVTPVASKEAERLGLEFTSAALKSKGFAKFMEEVQEKTKGSTDSIGKLFGGVEAIVPMLALAGSAGKSFTEILADMEKKAGETTKAFDEMSNTADFKFKRVKAAASIMGITFGDAILDLILPAVDLLLENFDSVQRVALGAANALRGMAQVGIGIAATFDLAGGAVAGLAATLDAFITEGTGKAKEMWDIYDKNATEKFEKYGEWLKAFEMKDFDPAKSLGKNVKAMADLRAALSGAVGAGDTTGIQATTDEAAKITADGYQKQMEAYAVYVDYMAQAKKDNQEFIEGIMKETSDARIAILEKEMITSDDIWDVGTEGLIEINQAMVDSVLAGYNAQAAGAEEYLQTYQQLHAEANRSVMSYTAEAAMTISNEMGGAISGVIRGVTTMKEAFNKFGEVILKMIVDWVVQRIVASAISKALAAGEAAAQMAAGAAVAAAWAPAAAAVSLATFGANSAPAIAGMVAAYGTAATLTKLPGYAEGGFIPATPGGKIVKVAEGGEGEWIIPESKTGGVSGGTTIQLLLDGRELARWFHDSQRDGIIQLRPA